MADFFKVFICLIFIFCKGIFSLPVDESSLKTAPNQKFRILFPNNINQRQRRAEEEQSGGGGGVQEFITTAIKDGIAASSAFDSPTMFIGGFSVMMQPMPNGTEFSGQLMQMAPHYMSLLPGLGRK